MKETYVTFKTAKLLKEKGFDWECLARYDKPILSNNVSIFTEANAIDWNTYYYGSDYKFSAPTQQMAMSWLRTTKNIHITPTIGCDVDRTPRIFYSVVIAVFNDRGDITYIDPLDENGYDKSEDAVKAALKYCLTNLI